MTQLTITKQSCTDKKADGSPLVSKDGKPLYRVGIKTQEYPDVWINGLMSYAPQWEGTTQELVVTDKEWNGRALKEFKLPTKSGGGGLSADDRAILQQILDQIATLRAEVDRCNKYIVRLGQKLDGPAE